MLALLRALAALALLAASPATALEIDDFSTPSPADVFTVTSQTIYSGAGPFGTDRELNIYGDGGPLGTPLDGQVSIGVGA